MRRPSHPLVELTLSRLREFYREPGAVFWVFGFPILLAIGLGIAFRNQPPSAPVIGVENRPGNGWVLDALEDRDDVVVQRMEPDAAARALRVGAVDVLVRATGESAVTYRYDATRDASRAARAVLDAALQGARGRIDVVSVEDETVTETGARYIDFLMPGVIALNLMSSSMWGIGYTIVLARKRRLLKRFAATPMRRSHYLLAYILSRLLFLVFEVGILILVGRLIFDVTVQGSYLAMGVVCLFGAGTFAGIALLVAARAESIEAATGWLNAVQLPMWLVSGTFFSYERFPEFLHPFIQALPLTALNDSLRVIVNEGGGLMSALPELLWMAAWGGLTFLVALRTFRWQ